MNIKNDFAFLAQPCIIYNPVFQDALRAVPLPLNSHPESTNKINYNTIQQRKRRQDQYLLSYILSTTFSISQIFIIMVFPPAAFGTSLAKSILNYTESAAIT